MPVRYVVEMFCDRIAASKTYKKDAYTNADPYEYYKKSHDHYIIHPESDALLRKMLLMLKNEGEERTFCYVRKKILKKAEISRLDDKAGGQSGKNRL